MAEEYIQQRIRAIESELELLKRKVIMAKLSEEEIAKKIKYHRKLVRDISKSLKVTEDPDTYIAKLRAKEY